MIAYPVYRCRMCGEKYSSSGVGTSSSKLMLSLEMMQDFNKTGSIRLYGRGYPGYHTHECTDGSIGISDLLGVKIEGFEGKKESEK
jgi:hypothetical protein